MSYRNDKRKASIWLLENICVPAKMTITAIIGPGKRTEVNQKNYDWFELKELISKSSYDKNLKSSYDKNLIRDACDLLRIKEHIDILENEIDRFDIKVKAFKEGEVALREDYYQDDINNYLSDKRFRNLRWQLPLLIVLLTAINFGYTFYKDGKSTSELKEIKQVVNNLKQQLEESKSSNKEVERKINEHFADTIIHKHSSKGQ